MRGACSVSVGSFHGLPLAFSPCREVAPVRAILHRVTGLMPSNTIDRIVRDFAQFSVVLHAQCGPFALSTGTEFRKLRQAGGLAGSATPTLCRNAFARILDRHQRGRGSLSSTWTPTRNFDIYFAPTIPTRASSRPWRPDPPEESGGSSWLVKYRSPHPPESHDFTHRFRMVEIGLPHQNFDDASIRSLAFGSNRNAVGGRAQRSLSPLPRWTLRGDPGRPASSGYHPAAGRSPGAIVGGHVVRCMPHSSRACARGPAASGRLRRSSRTAGRSDRRPSRILGWDAVGGLQPALLRGWRPGSDPASVHPVHHAERPRRGGKRRFLALC